MWLVSDTMFVIVQVLMTLLNWRYGMYGATPSPWLNCACSIAYCMFMFFYAYFNSKSRIGLNIGVLQLAGAVIALVISVTQADAVLLGLLGTLLLVPFIGLAAIAKGTACIMLMLAICLALLVIRLYARRKANFRSGG